MQDQGAAFGGGASATRKLTRMYQKPSGGFGASVTGASWRHVVAVRASVHDTLVRELKGRSCTLDMAFSAADPASVNPSYDFLVGPIFALAGAV